MGGAAPNDAQKTTAWMDARQRQVGAAQSAPGARTASYFGYQPELSAQEEAELRHRQLEERKHLDEINRQNMWMLGPVLAPDFVVLGAEGLGLLAGRAAAKRLAAVEPAYLNVLAKKGETIHTILGKRAHKVFRDKVRAKGNGWVAEKRFPTEDGRYVIPDAMTPPRNPANPKQRFNLDLKSDTPSGRAAGEKKKIDYKAKTKKIGPGSSTTTRMTISYDAEKLSRTPE